MLNIRLPDGGFLRGGHPRPKGMDVTGIVMHASAGRTLAGDIQTLHDRGLAYHALIDHDGSVVKCLPYSWTGYHAGNSYGWNEAAAGLSTKQGAGSKFIEECSVNGYTLGFSFVNLNNGVEEITKEQLEAARELVEAVKVQFPELRYVTTHLEVSPHRKTDPILLDLDKFAADCGLKAWHFPG